MKIAIIGSGISGLTSAYFLNKEHDVYVYEKNNYIGGHTHTHSIKEDNKIYNIDSGFIVFNEDTYPNFIKLLKALDVEVEKTSMGFSVKSTKKNLEYAGNSFNSIFAQKSNLFRITFWKMLSDIIKFNKVSQKDLKNLDSNISLENYLNSKNFSLSFKEDYIYPMGASIWSTKSEFVKDMSAVFFINFFKNHSLLKILNRSQWYVIKGGSNQYVKKMINQFESNILLNSMVTNIRRLNNQVEIKTLNQDPELYDKVIIASHSNQALELLEDPSALEAEILSSIPYQDNSAVLHTDTSVLPTRRTAWSSWNYNLDQDSNSPMAMTYNMNILQNLKSKSTYCVTLNNSELVNDKSILKKLKYEHPLLNIESSKAQTRKNEINGKNNTYYCGAYWGNGFHEDGVVSALEVCKDFGIKF
ncbi:MAG: FAD-dependent oxidoreductase [Candidatus Marinimicrobia bacterium]|nr:FAD-dependent oxidoreductase [Candidatus Neomarinimicrobiota bacterium]|tara:strand:+ start:2136 stop:3380 length:1245 start_codon:yes stop_codon:yes gene_type:complete